jgi:hypothetical protein
MQRMRSPVTTRSFPQSFLRLSPCPASPQHCSSTLQITLGEHKSIADFALWAREKGKAELIHLTSPGSVHSQQSNTLPATPQLLASKQLEFLLSLVTESALEPFPELAPLEPLPKLSTVPGVMSEALEELAPLHDGALFQVEGQDDLHVLVPQQELPSAPSPGA